MFFQLNCITWFLDVYFWGFCGAGASNMGALSTKGSIIVDNKGDEVRLACVNWYGAHMERYAVNGLDLVDNTRIVEVIEYMFDWQTPHQVGVRTHRRRDANYIIEHFELLNQRNDSRRFSAATAPDCDAYAMRFWHEFASFDRKSRALPWSDLEPHYFG